MSASELQDRALVDVTFDAYENDITPKLVQETENGRLEVEPAVVTRLGGTLPWDTESKQLQNGETVTSSSGEQSMRLVFGAILPKEDFEALARMRQRSTTVTLVSAGYTGPATFDELKWDRVSDANAAVSAGSESVSGPFYDVLLQSKQSDGESGN